MDITYMIIAGLIGALIVLMIAPRILSANRGKMLRNIALWVAIFLLVALAFRLMGPGRDMDRTETGVESGMTAPTPPATPGTVEQPRTEPPADTTPDTQTPLRQEDGFSNPNQ